MCEIVSTDATTGPANAGVATAVVSAIAGIEEVDPLDLEFELADYVHGDDLDALVRRHDVVGSEVRVYLEIRDYTVVVETPGRVTVARPCGNPDRCGAVPEPPLLPRDGGSLAASDS